MIKIVTDSTADIPLALREKENIVMVPLRVLFGEETYLDWVELQPEEFYKKLVASKILPRTSQPSPEDFVKAYQDIDGEIISIHISQHLSGTLQSAHMASDMLPGARIEIVDSTFASMALGLQALEAARAANAGRDKEEIMKIIDHYRQNTKIYFAVDTLEYLHKNGRIGKAKALLGGLLNVKPLLSMDQGIIVPLEQARGKAKAVQRMIELMQEDCGGLKSLKVVILHASIEEEALKLQEKVEALIDIDELIISSVGSVIGTHTGPGLLAIVTCPAYGS